MPLAAGACLGHYEILASLGAGGMGEVYHARDPRLDRPVAIKILTSSRGSSSLELERFRREARAIARVSHPNICTLHDVGLEDGVAFLVMELLDGETLAERLEHGRIPVERALAIGAQIAEALDAAHGRDVIHRDLKPGNVMLTAAGVKLLDFGLAKLRDVEYVDSATTSTRTLLLTDEGTVLGTLPYMAPEQVEGRAADARTDIFALGVVLYEMTTGTAPFTGASRASLAAAILTHDPAPISSHTSTAPASLERIVKKCLAKNPDERWQSARDLASALRWSTDDGIALPAAANATANNRRRRLTTRAPALAMGATLAAAAIWALACGRRIGATGARARVHPGHVQTRHRLVRAIHARWPELRLQRQLGGAAVRHVSRPARQPGRAVRLAWTMGTDPVDFPRRVIWPCSSVHRNRRRSAGTRTLGRMPMAGGARRDLLTGVVDADWIPGTDTLAVIRDPGGDRPWTVEFQPERRSQARAAWSLRVSPDGESDSILRGPWLFTARTEAIDTVIEKSGRKSTLSRNWSGIGLAWTPSGNEVWFTAASPGYNGPQLPGVSLTGHGAHGAERAGLARAARHLRRRQSPAVSKLDSRQHGVQAAGRSSERDSDGGVATFVPMSPDGQTLIFHDGLSGRPASGADRVSSAHRRIRGRSPWRGHRWPSLSGRHWVLNFEG